MTRAGTAWLVLAVALAWSADATAESGGKTRRILVQRISPVGVDAQLARTIEEALVLELGSREGLSVVSPAEVERSIELAEDQAALGCDQLEQCMVEVQRKLQADTLINGKLSKLGDDYILALGVVDLVNKVVGLRVTRQARDAKGLRGGIADAVDELLGKRKRRAAFKLKPGQQLRLSVMPLAARGVPPATADAMTQILSAELNGIEGISVISRDDITAMLDKVATESEMGCTDNMECVVEIGAALGLSKLVTGSVGEVSGSFVVSTQLIDIRMAQVENRVLESFEGDESELQHAIKLSAYQLAGVDYEAQPGRVAFTFNVEQADVRIGKRHAKLAGSELLVENLMPGRYPLRVVADPEDYYPLQTDIYVAPNGSNVRTFTLEETATPWYGSWWFWTVTGVVIAGAAATTVIVLNQEQPSTGSGSVTIEGLRFAP